MKVCTNCSTEKPLDQFWADRSKKHGKMARCRDCKSRSTREYRKANPDYGKQQYWKDTNKQAERHLKAKYGITLADYDQMFASQGGRFTDRRSSGSGTV